MKKKSLYFLLVIILINSTIVYGSVDSLNDKLNDTKNKISQVKKNKEENEKKLEATTKEIEKLDAQVDQANNELQEIEEQLKKLDEEIQITKQNLEEAEKNLEERNETLNARLRVMYKNGFVGYLEVLLGSSDIKDLFSRIDMIKRITNHDVEMLKFMKEQRNIIEQNQKMLEAQQSSVESAKREIEVKKQELEIASRAKEDLMRSLENDKEILDKLEEQLLAEANAIEAEIRKKQSSEEYVNGEMMWPVTGYTRISSPFGYRIHPISKTRSMHTGIDIPAPTGTPIKAANGGTVQFSGRLGGYGNAVIIDHGGKITTLYAHNSQLLVKEGDKVTKGQTIAKAGSTGNSTGPHLHFEVRVDGKYEDPIPWVKGN